MERAYIFGINGIPILLLREIIKAHYKVPIICELREYRVSFIGFSAVNIGNSLDSRAF